MVQVERLRGVLRRHPLAVDSALAAAIGVVTMVAPNPDAIPGQQVPLAATVAAGAACLALVTRRLRPRASFMAVVLATAVAVVLAHGLPIWNFAEVVALYTVAVATDRRTTVRAFVLSALVLLAAVAVISRNEDVRFFLDGATGMITSGAIAAAFGDAVRSRRAYLAATVERADRAERTREEEARRQVVEERLRIARELHDVVAHHVAVVSVQAGLAAHLILKQPQAAQSALHQVQQASATILDELAGILSVLRHPDDQDQPGLPAPGLGELDELVRFYVDAGLPVQLSRAGQPRQLTGNTDLVAYRVLQEALTNAHKHGGPCARVAVTYTPADVVLDVVNPLRQPAAERFGTGNGLTGMRERAAAVGGDLQVRSDEAGEFRVRLTLPTPVAVP